MTKIIQNVQIVNNEGNLETTAILVQDGRIAAIGASIASNGAQLIDGKGQLLSPGFIDVHVHLREPGESIKKRLKQERKQQQKVVIQPFALCQIQDQYLTVQKISHMY